VTGTFLAQSRRAGRRVGFPQTPTEAWDPVLSKRENSPRKIREGKHFFRGLDWPVLNGRIRPHRPALGALLKVET